MLLHSSGEQLPNTDWVMAFSSGARLTEPSSCSATHCPRQLSVSVSSNKNLCTHLLCVKFLTHYKHLKSWVAHRCSVAPLSTVDITNFAKCSMWTPEEVTPSRLLPHPLILFPSCCTHTLLLVFPLTLKWFQIGEGWECSSADKNSCQCAQSPGFDFQYCIKLGTVACVYNPSS